ncbi:hypothetical protein CYANOKiyG1_78330 [Okeania sp. KiyG1]|nr:hypothetical protein CYANOKiyG1_78330 [Okeania sp. KiyG1]
MLIYDIWLNVTKGIILFVSLLLSVYPEKEYYTEQEYYSVPEVYKPELSELYCPVRVNIISFVMGCKIAAISDKTDRKNQDTCRFLKHELLTPISVLKGFFCEKKTDEFKIVVDEIERIEEIIVNFDPEKASFFRKTSDNSPFLSMI